MGLPKELATIKRFGVRYGRTTRHKYAIQDRLQKQIYKCPYCAKQKVKRVSIGLWSCRKCGAFFTGKAYTIEKKRITAEELVAQFLPGEQQVQQASKTSSARQTEQTEQTEQITSSKPGEESSTDTAPSKPKKEKKPKKSKKEEPDKEEE